MNLNQILNDLSSMTPSDAETTKLSHPSSILVITTQRLLRERQAYLRYNGDHDCLNIHYIEGGAGLLENAEPHLVMRTDMKLHTRFTSWLPVPRDLHDESWFILELIDVGSDHESQV